MASCCCCCRCCCVRCCCVRCSEGIVRLIQQLLDERDAKLQQNLLAAMRGNVSNPVSHAEQGYSLLANCTNVVRGITPEMVQKALKGDAAQHAATSGRGGLHLGERPILAAADLERLGEELDESKQEAELVALLTPFYTMSSDNCPTKTNFSSTVNGCARSLALRNTSRCQTYSCATAVPLSRAPVRRERPMQRRVRRSSESTRPLGRSRSSMAAAHGNCATPWSASSKPSAERCHSMKHWVHATPKRGISCVPRREPLARSY